uniref:Predicted nucleic acid-binding protein, contains PIN domain n=1 Tax=Candidatus Kentrum sp. FM TaxID=2126340 RepID=A0A450TNC1_9GAMM|nr:MAG: Predicted nucleic acid-binding protein, contains PIN domain [Candidatus Kentron sp. FM]VFJ69335.1 MAG: Predicted nucleic acid-binding protein, contains PIN domain [Candidatus Kentron sp. FM]VFK17685.1 MAG: Predicted nucleic acid-binding protein, contains PIN domain [Candidatus Kentron sp. FM]
MLIVADSSALVALALCDGLALLDGLFHEIKIPRAVFDEVVIEGKPAAVSLGAYLAGKTVPVVSTETALTFGGLGQGEIEAMALYKALRADYLLVDDRQARKAARLNHITIIGSQGILLLAKHAGLIPAVAPFLDRLRNSNIRISEHLIQKALKLANESDP